MSSEPALLETDSNAPQRTPEGLAYRCFGAGEPLVLLHGGSGSWTHWSRNLPALARERLLVVPDLPGCGDSTGVAADISIDAYAGIVATALRQVLGPAARFDLVGFSFGGLTAAGVATQLGPQVRRLCLLAPSGFTQPTGRVLGRRPRHTFPPGEDGEREFLRHHLLSMMLAHPASVDATAIELHRVNLANARFDNRTLSWCDRIVGFVSALECPVRLIYGADDRTAFPSIAARVALLRAARPSLGVDLVPGAGHWAQYEQPAAFNELLLRFLAGPTPPSTGDN